ncbi:MAG: hypothetical protein FWF31_02260 [Desulfobulbus sp.]|nr:hypothetical protein [Desulfobulbus sp.]
MFAKIALLACMAYLIVCAALFLGWANGTCSISPIPPALSLFASASDTGKTDRSEKHAENTPRRRNIGGADFPPTACLLIRGVEGVAQARQAHHQADQDARTAFLRIQFTKFPPLKNTSQPTQPVQGVTVV